MAEKSLRDDLRGNLRKPDCDHTHLSYPWADVNATVDCFSRWLRGQKEDSWNDSATLDRLIEKLKAERFQQ